MDPKKLFHFRDNNNLGKYYEYFRDMRYEKEFCDVIFRIGDYTLCAHRIILIAAIPGLRRGLFTSSQNEIVLSDISPDALECLIDFAYNEPISVTMEEVKNLLHAACLLGVEEVIDECCRFLLNQLNSENVLDIREIADYTNCSDLLAITHNYIRHNFDEVSEKEDFLRLPFPRLKEIIGSDDLRVLNEEKVFETLIKWVKVSPDDRKADLPELLKEVRLPLLTPLYLKNHVAEEPLIRTSLPCRDLLDEARNYHFFPEDRPLLPSLKTDPRPAGNTSLVMPSASEQRIYTVGCKYFFTLQHFNQREKVWKTRNVHLYEKGSASAAVDNAIFIVGRSEMFRYSPMQYEFINVGKRPTERIFPAVAAKDKNIYICGGFINGTSTNIVECYDTANRKWTDITPMIEPRKSPAAAVLEESIYILGGRNKSGVHKSAERYDTQAKEWISVSPMLTERAAAGSAVLNGRIYVCGGETADLQSTATAEVYNPVENKWKFISPMEKERQFLKLAPYGGKLYALGGKDSERFALSSIEIYDPETDSWELQESSDFDGYIIGAMVMSFPVV